MTVSVLNKIKVIDVTSFDPSTFLMKSLYMFVLKILLIQFKLIKITKWNP